MTTEEINRETAKFSPTGKTITHRGTTYDILNPPADETRADSPYVLRSPRGKFYALVRNKPKPHLLFGVGLYGGGFKCMPGWFSDQTGELRSVG